MYTIEPSCGTFLSVVALHPLCVQCTRTRAPYVQLQRTICFFNQADTFSSICKVHPKAVHPSSLTLSVGFCMFAYEPKLQQAMDNIDVRCFSYCIAGSSTLNWTFFW